jgi:hypothetical protein
MCLFFDIGPVPTVVTGKFMSGSYTNAYVKYIIDFVVHKINNDFIVLKAWKTPIPKGMKQELVRIMGMRM